MAPKRPADAAPADGEKRARLSGPGAEAAAPSAAPRSAAAIQAQIDAARAKIAAQMAARAGSSAAPASGAPTPAASSAPKPPPPAATRLPARPTGAPAGLDMAAIQARINAAKQSLSARNADAGSSAGGSGIHPLLLPSANNGAAAQAASSHNKRGRPNAGAYAPKFPSLAANARTAAPAPVAPPEPVNPYLAASNAEASSSAPGPKGRALHKPLTFHKPGRHVREAEQLRREQKMEELKKRIADAARKAGLEETGSEEKLLRRQPPPDVEWWDQALLPSSTYDSVPDDFAESSTAKGKEAVVPGGPLIVGEGSPIDSYIQHPIPIPAPSDKIRVEPRGVMLTKKEMRKMRKQRRAAELQDKRDRIKMGLLPPEAPKVKLSNLMRVLTSEAVADPTKVEARVRREVAARREQHERTNLERKLTPEQIKAKQAAKMEKDEAKGVHCSVYRIKHLASPSHRFKVRKNAIQHGLTGLCIYHPSFALVVVEGPAKAIKDYRRLMTVRINWQDPGRPRDSAPDDDDDEAEAGNGGAGPSKSAGAAGRDAEQAQQQAELAGIDWSSNTCELIFEGPLRERMVSKGFITRNCESDAEARKALGPRMEGYLSLAKRVTQASEDV